MKIVFWRILCTYLVIQGCINKPNVAITPNSENNFHKMSFCEMLDSFEFNYYNDIGNEFLTARLGSIEDKTAIKCNCDWGFAGVTYLNDSLFDVDMIKYRKALGCKDYKLKSRLRK